MKIYKTKLKGLKIIKGKKHYDNRGYFREVLKKKNLKNNKFIFWCVSSSKKNVIRGLHFQIKKQQDIYVSVIKGKIFDVVLDLRKNSKTYGKYHAVTLSNKNSTSLLIPAGCAHGFCSLERENLILYGISNYRSPKNEVGILWNDKSLKIKWPVKYPIFSNKDKNNITFEKFNNSYFYN